MSFGRSFVSVFQHRKDQEEQKRRFQEELADRIAERELRKILAEQELAFRREELKLREDQHKEEVQRNLRAHKLDEDRLELMRQQFQFTGTESEREWAAKKLNFIQSVTENIMKNHGLPFDKATERAKALVNELLRDVEKQRADQKKAETSLAPLLGAGVGSLLPGFGGASSLPPLLNIPALNAPPIPLAQGAPSQAPPQAPPQPEMPGMPPPQAPPQPGMPGMPPTQAPPQPGMPGMPPTQAPAPSSPKDLIASALLRMMGGPGGAVTNALGLGSAPAPSAPVPSAPPVSPVPIAPFEGASQPAQEAINLPGGLQTYPGDTSRGVPLSYAQGVVTALAPENRLNQMITQHKLKEDLAWKIHLWRSEQSAKLMEEKEKNRKEFEAYRQKHRLELQRLRTPSEKKTYNEKYANSLSTTFRGYDAALRRLRADLARVRGKIGLVAQTYGPGYHPEIERKPELWSQMGLTMGASEQERIARHQQLLAEESLILEQIGNYEAMMDEINREYMEAKRASGGGTVRPLPSNTIKKPDPNAVKQRLGVPK